MECPLTTGRGTELFVAYSARTLSTHAQAELRQHLEICGQCRNMAADQEAVWHALDAWTPADLSSNFDAKLYARIASEERRPFWRRWLGSDMNANWSWKPASPVAATCVALLAAFLLNSPVPDHHPQANVQSNIDIEQVERALDDIDMLKQLGLAATPAPARQPGRSASM